MDSFTNFETQLATTTTTVSTSGSVEETLTFDDAPYSIPVDAEAAGSGDIIGFCVIS
ncbi:pheromone precursor [Lentinula raphanica]|nr:pheromone precursor [Lentinula raphanica]